MTRCARTLIAAVLLATAAGCAQTLDFTSPSALGDGVRGKRWRVPQYLEVNLDNVAVDSKGASHRAFALAPYGDQAYLSATLYDTVNARFKGYARRYVAGDGWAAVGTNFGAIADTGTNSLAFGGIGISTGGVVMTSFFEPGGGFEIVTASNNGSWQTAKDFTATATPSWDEEADSGWASSISVGFDALQGGIVSYVAGTNPVFAAWDSTAADGVSITLHTITSIVDLDGANVTVTTSTAHGLTTGDSITVSGSDSTPTLDGARTVTVTSATEFTVPLVYVADGTTGQFSTTELEDLGTAVANSSTVGLFDGNLRYCVFWESSTSTTEGACQSTLDTFGTVTSVTLAASNGARGISAASDGDGSIMVVYFEKVSSKFALRSKLITDGTAGSALTVSTGMATSFVAAASLTPDDATEEASWQAGIGYLGDGKYIAVWAAKNAGSQTAALYSSVYASGAWSTPLLVGNGTSYDSDKFPYVSVTVHGNGDGNAVLAVRDLIETADGVYKYFTVVRRYQIDNGWLDASVVGNGCDPDHDQDAGVVTDPLMAYCTHRPAAVVLESGDAVVVFQDQDSAGKFRLVGVDFK